MSRLVIACVIVAISFTCRADDAPQARKANDVLAKAIDDSLARRPTVVYWVFDESVSLVAKRKEIAKRLGRVFLLLNNPGLQNMVMSFGARVHFVTNSPTSDVDIVANAVEQIPIDDSGVEMTFSAIHEVVKSAKTLRQPKENVVVVIFTDEVGDDGDLAERTTEECREARIPVYAVGVPAPFGLGELKIAYAPRDQQDVTLGVVNRGPESRLLEVVQLANDRPIDSGFGPFLLAKICADTGGAYFRANTTNGEVSEDENARKEYGLHKFFTLETMEPYRPSYASREAYERELASNRAKRALVDTATRAIASPTESLQTVFPIRKEEVPKELLGEAQKAVARVQAKVDGMYGTLVAGLPDREKVEEKRWQAGYDLALGRVLATKVRADAYALAIGEAKNGMQFKDNASDTWQLMPSDKLSAGLKTKEIAKETRALLEKVVAEHPGTPWAYYASEELKTPFGYEWIERHASVHKDAAVSRTQKRDLKRL